MKRNKKLMRMVLVIAIGIWGVIFYQIYQIYLAPPAFAVTTKQSQQPTADAPMAAPDSTKLIANYADPFLKFSPIEQSAAKPQTKSSKQAAKPAPKPPAIKWPDVVYSGMIRKAGSAELLGMIQVDGRSHLSRTGDSLQLMTVESITADSVFLALGDQRRSFAKNHLLTAHP